MRYHVSQCLPAIPDGRISRIRFWPWLGLICRNAGLPVFQPGLNVGPYTPAPANSLPPCSLPRPHQSPSSVPGSGPVRAKPPSAQSPFAPDVSGGGLPPPGEALPSLRRSYGLMRQSQILRLPLLSLVEPVFAGSCQSLLDVGPSRYYLCNHSMVACAHTPGKVRGASVHFFPRTYSLSFGDPKSAFPKSPRRNFYGEETISGRQQFFYIQASIFAWPSGCAYPLRGSRAVFTTPILVRYLAKLWYSYASAHGQLMRLDFHQLDCSLIGCSVSLSPCLLVYLSTCLAFSSSPVPSPRKSRISAFLRR